MVKITYVDSYRRILADLREILELAKADKIINGHDINFFIPYWMKWVGNNFAVDDMDKNFRVCQIIVMLDQVYDGKVEKLERRWKRLNAIQEENKDYRKIRIVGENDGLRKNQEMDDQESRL